MSKFVGAEKAAVILMALGEKTSANVLKKFTTEEIKRIGIQMSAIKGVDKAGADEVLEEFKQEFYEDSGVRVRGGDFLRNLLPGVLGAEQADSMISEIEEEQDKIPFKNIRDIDPRVLANFIRNEHPQTVAIILAHMGHATSSEVVTLLPEALQFEVVNRIAHLETVPPDLIKEVDRVLEKELVAMAKEGAQLLGGVNTVAEILNHADKRTADSILQSMEEYDTDLADKVRKLMFVFEDLVAVNDAGIQMLLKEVGSDDLVLALKTASDELRNKILKNLSSRASQMLMEDMESLGPVRLADVETAQQNILGIARRLEKDGKIVLAGRDGGDTLV